MERACESSPGEGCDGAAGLGTSSRSQAPKRESGAFQEYWVECLHRYNKETQPDQIQKTKLRETEFRMWLIWDFSKCLAFRIVSMVSCSDEARTARLVWNGLQKRPAEGNVVRTDLWRSN